MARRGQAEMLDWIPRLIVLLIAVAIVSLVVRSYANRDVDAGSTEIAAYLARIERDPRLWLWEDPATGRATPGVLDAAKLQAGDLDAFFGVTGAIASKARIDAPCIAFEDTHDSVTYDLFAPIALAGLQGRGGAAFERRTLPVTVVSGTNRCTGTLTLSVVRPNVPRSVAA